MVSVSAQAYGRPLVGGWRGRSLGWSTGVGGVLHGVGTLIVMVSRQMRQRGRGGRGGRRRYETPCLVSASAKGNG